MILKKKEFFLFIFLVFLQSCSGGRIGDFFESSFNDLEKISQEENPQNNFKNLKSFSENKKTNNQKNEKIKKVENPKSFSENKKTNNQKNEKIKKVENPKFFLEEKKDLNSEKIQKQKNNKIKNSSKKRKIELQSYKIIFILKDVDPKDPTKELSTILRNSEVNFEIEKIERILNSKIRNMNKN
jgi:hypothetical protein